jgi:hypothetical protein
MKLELQQLKINGTVLQAGDANMIMPGKFEWNDR